MSKGERNRVKIRVRSAMAAQAQVEGRFLGGRPPYGYLLVDVGPHPNPAKAADGKRLHALAPDPQTAHVVRRIFAEYLAGRGLKAIAEGLTRDDIPSPSAYDPERNKHRCGIAWSWSAVRAILTNPRYTGLAGLEQAAASPKCSSTSTTSRSATPPSRRGTSRTSGSGPTSPSTSR